MSTYAKGRPCQTPAPFLWVMITHYGDNVLALQTVWRTGRAEAVSSESCTQLANHTGGPAFSTCGSNNPCLWHTGLLEAVRGG